MANNHAPLFPIELVAKDFYYAVQATAHGEAQMPVTTAIGGVYQEAIVRGYGSDNITGIVQLFTN